MMVQLHDYLDVLLRGVDPGLRAQGVHEEAKHRGWIHKSVDRWHVTHKGRVWLSAHGGASYVVTESRSLVCRRDDVRERFVSLQDRALSEAKACLVQAGLPEFFTWGSRTEAELIALGTVLRIQELDGF